MLRQYKSAGENKKKFGEKWVFSKLFFLKKARIHHISPTKFKLIPIIIISPSSTSSNVHPTDVIAL